MFASGSDARSAVFGLFALLVALLPACRDGSGETDDGDGRRLTRQELLDPQSCKDCHPKHYREWASSMHAYASSDPVFIAMNRRGQRETGGQLGDFCVKCHAPMALREGLTHDGQNLAEVPAELKGVTCYFCHNAVGIGEHFNNGVVLANDTIMRGGITDPQARSAHGAAYSIYHDRNRAESSLFCGSCHDIVTPRGVHLERTLQEYEASLFAKPVAFESCQGCHMDGRTGVAAANQGRTMPQRTVHEHLWPGVDVALTDFPDREAQRKAIECALGLHARVVALDHDGFGGFTARLETSAGHHQPSGSALDRRLWVEFTAYDRGGNVMFESGNIRDGELEEKAPGEAGYDRNLMLFRDWIYDERGELAHMFWDAAGSPAYPDGYRSLVLPAATAPAAAHSIEVKYRLARPADIARVTLRLRMRPVGVDVLEDLLRSGDLDPGVVPQMPTFTLHGAAVEWTADNPRTLRSLWPEDLVCPDSYLCLLEPDSPACAQN